MQNRIMGCLFSCFTGRNHEETADDIGNEYGSYPPFYSHNTSPFGQCGATESTNFKLQCPHKSQSSDEDVCPTCLEEYTDQNPKIIAKCSHHYHLGCIHDWMERSNTCPACRQVMIFDEAA